MSSAVAVYRSNDKDIQLTVFDNDGTSRYNLTDCAVNMYLKLEADDTIAEAIMTKEGTIFDTLQGIVIFDLVPADTESTTLKRNFNYTLDFVLTSALGKTYTVLRTTFTLL